MKKIGQKFFLTPSFKNQLINEVTFTFCYENAYHAIDPDYAGHILMRANVEGEVYRSLIPIDLEHDDDRQNDLDKQKLLLSLYRLIDKKYKKKDLINMRIQDLQLKVDQE